MFAWDYYTQWSAISLYLALLTRIYKFLANQEPEMLHEIQALYWYKIFDVGE